jgi:predicted esterase
VKCLPAYSSVVFIFSTGISFSAGWGDLAGAAGAPRLVAFNNSKTQPVALPFIPERKLQAGFWASFNDPGVITKLGETVAKTDNTGWQDTGIWMHLLVGRNWVSLPVHQTANAAAGSVKKGNDYFALHPAFWKNLQSTRPSAKTDATKPAGPAARTGAFTANLGDTKGEPATPDDREANPFYKFEGDPAKEIAQVTVPASYNGSKPFGLMVYLSPSLNGQNGLPAKWAAELAQRQIIWIGPRNTGNNNTAERRVWVAQQCRAWALHHYKIDPNRMIISGCSNGADAASATAVATPFGFNSALLFCPPCSPPVGEVGVPMEGKTGPNPVIKPVPRGIPHIKNTWRIVHVVGTKDSFLPLVRKSAKLVEGFKMGSKLHEIEGMGHAGPPSIAEYLDFVDAPRGGAAGGTFAAENYLAGVRRAMASDPERGRAAMVQLWNNHPEAHTHPDVLALLKEMEALPQ